MHNTDVKKPAGSSNSTAGGTDKNIVPDASSTSKAFVALTTRFALAAHALPANGAGMYLAVEWGVNQARPNLAAAIDYLLQMGVA
ncbi:MAG: hypothetical protein KBF33_07440 [Comamonas sp.]|nr:hypothetical protein [Comamonas sp.]